MYRVADRGIERELESSPSNGTAAYKRAGERAVASFMALVDSVHERIATSRQAFTPEVLLPFGRTLRPMEVFLVFCADIAETSSAFLSDKPEGKSPVYDCLQRLHANAVQVASEIPVLLESGFADGAHAGWRTLCWLAVAATAILPNGDETARTFTEHAVVDRCLEARDYLDPVGASDSIAALRQRRDRPALDLVSRVLDGADQDQTRERHGVASGGSPRHTDRSAGAGPPARG